MSCWWRYPYFYQQYFVCYWPACSFMWLSSVIMIQLPPKSVEIHVLNDTYECGNHMFVTGQVTKEKRSKVVRKCPVLNTASSMSLEKPTEVSWFWKKCWQFFSTLFGHSACRPKLLLGCTFASILFKSANRGQCAKCIFAFFVFCCTSRKHPIDSKMQKYISDT